MPIEERPPLRIRKLIGRDRDKIEYILVRCGVFTAAEVSCGMELIDTYLSEPDQKDYLLFSAVDGEDEPIGYVCYGPTPLTDRVYDLYWIAVDPLKQGSGVGKALLSFVEDELRKERCRMLLIETSSQPKYKGTRAFYLRSGFREVSRIEDFYSVGDDKVTYAKVYQTECPSIAL
jgi:ribosomal protein S18 acetylase RimI-like enzyme